MADLENNLKYKDVIKAIEPTDPVYYDDMNKVYLGQLLSNIKRIKDGDEPVVGVGAWKPKTYYKIGQVVYPCANGRGMSNEVRLYAKTEGISGAVEPADLDIKKTGEDVSDGAVTWTVFRQHDVLKAIGADHAKIADKARSVDDIVVVEMRSLVKHGDEIKLIPGFTPEEHDFIAAPAFMSFPKSMEGFVLTCYVPISGANARKLICAIENPNTNEIYKGQAFVLVTAVKKPKP